MKWFQTMRSKRLFYRILTLLLAMAGMMFLMAFLFMRSYIASSYERRARDSAQQLLSTAGEYVDLALLDLGRAMQQLLWNTDVTAAILVPDEVSYLRKVEIVKALSTFEQDYPLVDGTYLLTYANGMLYDAQGNILPLGQAPVHGYLPQFNSAVEAETLGDGAFSTLVLTEHGALALLQKFPTPEENGALLVEIREDRLFQFLSQATGESGEALEIRDRSGALIYAVGVRDSSDTQAGHYTGRMGWTFQSWQDAGWGRLTLGELLQLVGLWALLFGAASAAAAVLITRSIYRPIRKLRAIVEDEEAAQGEHELDAVRRVYESTLRQKTDLTHEVAEMTPIVRDRLYKNLLEGKELSEESLPHRLAYLNSPFSPAGCFSVLVAGALEEAGGAPSQRMGDLCRRLSRSGAGETAGYQCECIRMDPQVLALILFYGETVSAAQVKGAELELTRRIRAYARESGAGETLLVGRGKPCRGITSLRHSYEEAMEDLRYRQNHSGAGPEEQGAADCQTVLELAMGGDTDGAARALEVLLQQIGLEDQPHGGMRAACDAVMERMVEALLGLHADEEKLGLFEPYYRGAEHAAGSQLVGLVQTVGTQAIGLMAYYGQKNRNRYVARARSYIEEHCTDSRLSLDVVAESVGIHSAYLSRLFYEGCGVNFVSYVNECRVEQAKRLLRQSKMPTQEVGLRSGFNSMQNFNRVFKRYAGMTPGAYRKQETEQGGTQ